MASSSPPSQTTPTATTLHSSSSTNGTANEFAIVTIEKTGIYPTSYDCTKKLTEIENVICHVDSLAALDVQLNAVYKSLSAKLAGPQLDALREEQRQWLTGREKTCPIYKGWLNCLAGYYQKRIDELKKHTPADSPKELVHPF